MTAGRGRRRDERGAVLILVGIAMTTLLTFTAIAIDLGYQRIVRRDMQALADVVALDLVRLVDGRSEADIVAGTLGEPSLEAAKQASIERNDDTHGGSPDVVADLGCVAEGTTEFSSTCPAGLVPNAVEVTASDEFDYFFRPGQGAATRHAIAVSESEPIAEISIGSRLANVNAQTPSLLNPLLTGLLGGGNPPASISLVGYQGLANAFVDLDALALAMGFGTADALLEAPSVSVASLLGASATVLGPSNPATAHLTALQANLTTRASPLNVRVGDLFDVAAGTEVSGLGTRINAFDLVMGSLQLANRGNFLHVPGVGVAVPGVASVGIGLTVIEGPKTAIGPARQVNGVWVTRARTAQIDLDITAGLLGSGPPICVLVCLPGIPVGIDLELHLDAAAGTAELRNIACTAAVPTQTSVHGHTDAATLVADGSLSVGPLTIPLAEANAPIASGDADKTFNLPPLPSAVQQMAASGLGLSSLALANLNLVGVDVGLVLGVLSPITASLDTLILTPLLQALGVSISGADLRTLDADCGFVSGLALVG